MLSNASISKLLFVVFSYRWGHSFANMENFFKPIDKDLDVDLIQKEYFKVCTLSSIENFNKTVNLCPKKFQLVVSSFLKDASSSQLGSERQPAWLGWENSSSAQARLSSPNSSWIASLVSRVFWRAHEMFAIYLE